MIGEFFGATHDFEYNIGDKLYEFAIMSYKDFDKLKTMYTQLLELVCTAKESNTMDEKLDCFFKMFQIVRACLEFSPYTHFYTQVLIDIIVKTWIVNTFLDTKFKTKYVCDKGLSLQERRLDVDDVVKLIKEKQFKEWSEKARELRDTYTNEQIEDFKIELKKLSDLYWK